MLLLGITHGLIRVSSLDAGPQSARVRAEEVRTERKEPTGGNYSTVKNAQRLSAISSIRLSGRISVIDI
jgi:hypothetical protein